MDKLSPHEIAMMFLSLGVLLGSARILGELAKLLDQPTVLGEIIAGVLLGPTVLGSLAPSFTQALFPTHGPNALFLNSLTTLAVVMFLLVAGMEVDLSTILRQGKSATAVSSSGIIFPFALGLCVALLAPQFFGREMGADSVVFALFFATALSISALPVIAKTLMDTGLYRSEVGMVIIAAAVFDDLTGWIIFAVILGMIGAGAGHGLGVSATIGFTLAFVVFVLTIGRWLVNRILPWIHAHTTWPGGVLGLAMILAFFGAAFTEWIGVHAIFGSFLVGVAIGDSPHLRQRTRMVLYEFVSSLLAPLFFASIGLRVNFLTNFDATLVLLVFLIACAGKVFGCSLGARFSGMPWQESWAIGFGMNARGAMEIILGLLALQYGLIREPMFVALVIMALCTSMMSGPLMQRVLKQKKVKRFYDYSSEKTFLTKMNAWERREAIHLLAQPLAELSGIEASIIESEVWKREQLTATGIGNLVAVPHARIAGLNRPYVAIGNSEFGIDFDAPDGRSVRLVCMIIAPFHDEGAQLSILSDIAKTFDNIKLRDRCLSVKNYTEFLAQVKTESSPE
jgi:K+:H+ antiporter